MSSTFRSVYEGSVKSLYRRDAEPDFLYFDYTNDYSVFDWGKMPNPIHNKGKNLCLMGGMIFAEIENPDSWQALQSFDFPLEKNWLKQIFDNKIYQQYCQRGIETHFDCFTNESAEKLTLEQSINTPDKVYLKVHAADVAPLERHIFDDQLIYEYPRLNVGKQNQTTFLPLEIIFRFGVPEGSSLLGRLKKNPELLKQYGLDKIPEPGEKLQKPIIEFFTKLEAEDRKLSLQEALLISQLPFSDFENLYRTAELTALWIYKRFTENGMILWDGKIEMAYHSDKAEKTFVLVDTIGLDELRVSDQNYELSKEIIRRYYRKTEWHDIIKDCQQNEPKRFATEKQTLPNPPELPAYIQNAVEQIYSTVFQVLHTQNQDLLPKLSKQLEAVYTELNQSQEKQLVGTTT